MGQILTRTFGFSRSLTMFNWQKILITGDISQVKKHVLPLNLWSEQCKMRYYWDNPNCCDLANCCWQWNMSATTPHQLLKHDFGQLEGVEAVRYKGSKKFNNFSWRTLSIKKQCCRKIWKLLTKENGVWL